MNLALDELKTQAKKLLRAYNSNGVLSDKARTALLKLSPKSPHDIKLKHCLGFVAQQLGFDSWHHAQLVLSGNEALTNNPDMGTFLYNSACGTFINVWFSNYEEAKLALTDNPEVRWLLPYKKQFILVEKEYLAALNITEDIIRLGVAIQYDLYQGYNTDVWDKITYHVIRHRKNNA